MLIQPIELTLVNIITFLVPRRKKKWGTFILSLFKIVKEEIITKKFSRNGKFVFWF